MTKEQILNIIEQEGYEHQFEYKGIKCELIRYKREWAFNWCGYLIVPSKLDDVVRELYVHGDWSYASKVDDEYTKWGFDCNHYNDIGMWDNLEDGMFPHRGATYKTKDFVINELKSVINNLKGEN